MLLITRPKEESLEFAKQLEEYNIPTKIAPLFEIELLSGWEKEFLEFDSKKIIFTSANAVKSFAKLVDQRNYKILAVGEKTAAIARNLGFEEIKIAPKGNVDSLKEIIDDESTIYFSGEIITDEIKLPNVKRIINYRTKPLSLTKDDFELVDTVAIFSPHSAEIFFSNVNDLRIDLEKIFFFVLSKNIADKIKSHRIGFSRILIANNPTSDSMINLIRSFYGK